MRMTVDDYLRYQGNRQDIGIRCRILRKFNNLRTADVARDIGVTTATVNRFETGEIDSLKCFRYYMDKYGNTIFSDE